MLYNAPAGQDSFMEGELVPVGNGYYRNCKFPKQKSLTDRSGSFYSGVTKVSK
jgi:hypothetical protein